MLDKMLGVLLLSIPLAGCDIDLAQTSNSCTYPDGRRYVYYQDGKCQSTEDHDEALKRSMTAEIEELDRRYPTEVIDFVLPNKTGKTEEVSPGRFCHSEKLSNQPGNLTYCFKRTSEGHVFFKGFGKIEMLTPLLHTPTY